MVSTRRSAASAQPVCNPLATQNPPVTDAATDINPVVSQEPGGVLVPGPSGETQEAVASPRQDGPAVDTSSGSDDDVDDLMSGTSFDVLAQSLREALTARVGGSTAQGVASFQGEPIPSEPKPLQWRHQLPPPPRHRDRKSCEHAVSTAEKGPSLTKQFKAPPRTSDKKDAHPDDAKKWYQLPVTPITDDVKMQLRLLRLRGTFDPKRFYKSFDSTKFAKRFQIGTVLEGPTDFYSGRLTARERGQNVVSELLKDSGVRASRKKRYLRLQEDAQKHVRVKRRKTDMPRNTAKKHRPKH